MGTSFFCIRHILYKSAIASWPDRMYTIFVEIFVWNRRKGLVFYMPDKIRRIGILTSGGDAPGMNPAIRAAVRNCVLHDVIPVASTGAITV